MEDLNKLNNENSHCVQDLNLKFYNCALEYLNLWEESFDGASIFNWINLYSIPEWNEIENTMNLQHQNFGKCVKESEIETTY